MYLFQPYQEGSREKTKQIYIPLCIYFNLLEGFALGLVLVFTFHYVSISTSGKTLSAVKRLVFTFHYVSISTLLNTFLTFCQAYLHSTMYLFQLNDNYMFYLRKGIYIPLCIYFNDYTLVYTNDKNLFTFHYVSISTARFLINIFRDL